MSTVIFVDTDATGLNDGASWSNAYTTLQDALAVAVSGDEIWVAQGTYTPSAARSDTFQLVSGVEIYGGFTAGDTQLSDRDPDPATNGTVLSGDIGTLGDASDNVYHVVTSSGVDNTAVLDGFTIRDGNADGSNPDNIGAGIYNDSGSPTLQNLIVENNTALFGGGLFNLDASPLLTNVTIQNNTANVFGNGGGMLISGGNPILTNVRISGNYGGNGGGIYSFISNLTLTNVAITGNESRFGGGLFNRNTNLMLTNVTIAGNKAVDSGFGSGGGIFNDNSSPVMTNSVIWGNDADISGNVYNQGSSAPTYDYSLVQGLNPGGTNLDGTTATPDFVAPEAASNAPTTAGDYSLQSTSDAIDVGDNSFNTILTELDGNPRIIDGDGDSTATIDIGAYEYAPILAVPLVFGQPATIYVNSAGDLQGNAFGAGDLYAGDLFSNTDGTANPDDVIAGTDGDDNIWAGETGNDLIDAGEGNNNIGIGTGDAQVAAGSGDDFIYSIAGGGGTNVIDLGDGNNEAYLEGGNNNITTGAGNDTIGIGSGNDIVNAGAGDDFVYSIGDNPGSSNINLGSGNDKFWSTGGNNFIEGTDNNEIGIGIGSDIVFTGDGDDSVYSVNGGGGSNVLDLGNGTNEVWVENGDYDVTTGDGDDSIGLGRGSDTVDAGDGNNVIFLVETITPAEAGDKDILTGMGNDWVQTGDGNDRLNLGTHAGGESDFDIAFGQGGNDTFVLNEGTGFLTVGDFTQDEDLLEISGITFADIGSSFDTGRNSTWVWDNVSGDVLAELQGFTGTLTAGDFAAV